MVKRALDAVREAVLVFDLDCRLEELNPAGCALLGSTSEHLEGRLLEDLFTLVDDDDYEIDFAICVEDGQRLALGDGSRLVLPNGEERMVEGELLAVSHNDQAFGTVLVLRDIGDRQMLAQRLTRAARYDALTGLLNREAFETHAAEALAQARERQSSGPTPDNEQMHRGDVLCYMDLDQFQVVNDTCGHAAGDLLVQWIASLIRERLRDADVLARLGGDEFGLLIHDTPLPVAERLADEIHSALRNFRFVWQDKSFNVGMSIGMVPVTAEISDIGELTGAANRACFLAKQQGRGRTQIYRRDAVEVRRHQGQMNWVVKLQQALDEDLFELDWQQIVPLRPMVVNGPLFFEALLRFRDRDGTRHAPDEFLTAAERFGLMPAIDCWVVKKVISGLVAQPPEFLEALDCCTVNLSGASLGDRHVLSWIEQQLDSSGLPGQKICFEITETAAVSNLRRAAEMIDQLRRRHCRWALDDFGSGMSSFRYLHELPVDFVKIDGNIVTEVLHSSLSKAVVHSIHRVARVIDACTIAEHIENQELLEAVRDLGIDFGQGFHLAMPRPIGINEQVSDHLTP